MKLNASVHSKSAVVGRVSSRPSPSPDGCAERTGIIPKRSAAQARERHVERAINKTQPNHP